MNILVDTSVWSLILRRPRVDEENPYVLAFCKHIEQEDGLFLTGNILQELLDGVKSLHDFQRLLTIIDPFPLVELHRETYVNAARLRNSCRSKGIQAGPIDFLIAAACIEQGFPLLTADQDFLHISRYSKLVVISPHI